MMLESEEAEMCFTKDDQASAEKSLQVSSEAKAAARSLRDWIAAKVPAKRAKFAGSKTKVPEKGADISEAAFLTLAPLGARVRFDEFNGRWEATYRVPPGPIRYFSRSWGSRSHRACFDELLVELWCMAKAHGVPCHVDGLEIPGE